MNPIEKTVSRAGMSLLEVMISLLLMLVLVSVAMEASFKAIETSKGQNLDADLAHDADRIAAQVQADMAVSGWHFEGLPLADVGADMNVRYFPKVIQQAPGRAGESASLRNGQSAGFPHFSRASNQVVLPTVMGLRGNMGDGTSTQHHLQFGDSSTYFSGGSAVSPDAGTPSPLEASLYRESWIARSQELIFLRTARGAWTADPAEQESIAFDFSGPGADWRPGTSSGAFDAEAGWRRTGVIRPREWDVEPSSTQPDMLRSGFHTIGRNEPDVPEGRQSIPEALVHGAYVDFDAGAGDTLLTPRWETRVDWPNTTFTRRLDGRRIINPDHLREYTYALVPSPVGFGRLVRAYTVDDPAPAIPAGNGVGQAIARVGNLSVVVDDILSDHVTRVVFDTTRTDPSLAINEIRMRLFMAAALRNDPAKGLVLHRAEYTFAMRTSDSDAVNVETRAMLNFDDADRTFPY